MVGMGRGGQRARRGWRRDEAQRRSGVRAARRGVLVLFALDGWSRGARRGDGRCGGMAGGRAARWEDEPHASGRTGHALSILYPNRTRLVGIETFRGLGASGCTPEAGHPSAMCVVSQLHKITKCDNLTSKKKYM